MLEAFWQEIDQRFCSSSDMNGHKLDLHHERLLIKEMDWTDQKDEVQITQSLALPFKVKLADKEPPGC